VDPLYEFGKGDPQSVVEGPIDPHRHEVVVVLEPRPADSLPLITSTWMRIFIDT
jgi:hypothetical protein